MSEMHQDKNVDYKNAASYLVALRMFRFYPRALRCNPGLGPELFCENWMEAYLVESTPEFEDDVMRHFATLLMTRKI